MTHSTTPPRPRASDFTDAQATDLARHFLGDEWTASTFSENAAPLRYLHAGVEASFYALSWREVFRRAGVKLPYRPRFAASGKEIHLAGRAVAFATSNTMALRIANALEEYEPGRKGY